MHSAAIRTIDVRHQDAERVVGVFLLGDVLIDCGPAARVETLLEQLGEQRPRVLALTHIHLDHAGAAGTLVRHWPDLEVWVHARGAAHLIDPAKLLASATRLYGDDMDRLWGPVLAVPEANVRVLHGGERLGGFEVAYTPGHASHHVSYRHLESATAFVGDVAGVRVAPSEHVLPPTPPPDIDIEAWLRSLDQLRSWDPAALAINHFGLFGDVRSHLQRMAAALERFAARARTMSLEQFVAATRAEIDADPAAATAAGYALTAPAEQSYAGLARYWSKREAVA